MESNKFVETAYGLIERYVGIYDRAEDVERGCREVLVALKDDFFLMNYVVLSEIELYTKKKYITGCEEGSDIHDGISAFDYAKSNGMDKATCVQNFLNEARLYVYRLVNSAELTGDDDGR